MLIAVPSVGATLISGSCRLKHALSLRDYHGHRVFSGTFAFPGFFLIKRLMIIVLLLAFCSVTLAGEPYEPPRLQDGRPDFNGVWQVLNTANYNLEPHAAQAALALEEGPVVPVPAKEVVALGAVGAVPAGLGVVQGGTIPYKRQALARRGAQYPFIGPRAGADRQLDEATLEDPVVFTRPWTISMPIYRRKAPVTLRGSVTRVEWINPHAWIHLAVAQEDGRVVDWMVEASRPCCCRSCCHSCSGQLSENALSNA